MSVKENQGEKPRQEKREEEEYCMIAADLTMYGNPLRHLVKPKADPHHQQKVVKATKDGEGKGEVLKSDIVAADLNKYASPLDDRLTQK